MKINFRKIINEHTYSKTEKKKILSRVDGFISRLNNELKKKNIYAEAVLGGSAAKGTFLKGEFDCDVFVKFSQEYRQGQKNLSDLLEPVIKAVAKKYQRVHGSRDYFQMSRDSIEYEIVPVLEIKHPDEALNVTDSSPLHVDWILKKIKKTPGLTDEILLTKIFLKAQGLYGAESYIRGFSGHVVDILIVHYGSFLDLMNNARNWKMNRVIDVEKHYRNASQVMKALNESKLGPLIVIDPIEKERNAAASLSIEKFNLMKEVAKAFTESPNEDFFEKKETDMKKLEKDASQKNQELIKFQITPKKGKTDVIGAKLLKAYNHMIKKFKEHDFVIRESGWEWDKAKRCIMWFVFDKKPLELMKKQVGPPLKEKMHVEVFKLKYRNTFKENNRICAEVKRKHLVPRQLARELTKDIYVLEKMKKILLK